MKPSGKREILLITFIAFAAAIYSAMAQNSLNMNQPPALGNEPLSVLQNPLIVVRKNDRQLDLFDGERLVKTYKIALGFAPVGDKRREGDGKTPEGKFYIFTKNHQSKFYLSLGISYPTSEDAEQGFREKAISRKERDAISAAIKNKKMPPQKTALGGEIYIHGGGNTNGDWTWCCIALEDADIKEIFDGVTVGAAVRIEP